MALSPEPKLAKRTISLTYHKKTGLLIVIATFFRIAFASSLELSDAESYYWTFAQQPQWNYFDHPPAVALFIRLSTLNLWLHSELAVRSCAIVSSAICTWLIFRIGELTGSARTGWFAALLYTCSIYGSIAAGAFILPDAPLMIFWFSSLWLLLKLIRVPAHRPRSNLLWYLFGITSGLCIMSKVDGILLWFALLLYAGINERNWFRNKSLYLSAAITTVIISPVIIWNAQHSFASYTFHSSRITIAGASPGVTGFLKELFTEIFITNPASFFLVCAAITALIKNKLPVDKKEVQLILFCSLPLLLIVLFISVFRETKSHWTGPAYSSLFILAAARLSATQSGVKRNLPPVIKFSLLYLLFFGLLQVLGTNYLPGTLSTVKEGLHAGTDDATLDMYGWKTTARQFDSLYRSDTAQNVMPVKAPVVITDLYPASHVDYYMVYKTGQQTVGIGSVTDLHQYFFSNHDKRPLQSGDSAYYIVVSNLFDDKKVSNILKLFDSFDKPETISVYRSGLLCKKVFIFRLRGYEGDAMNKNR